jgi:hypothetical protein
MYYPRAGFSIKMTSEMNSSDFRKAVARIKSLPPMEDLRLEIKNIPLFEQLKAAGKMREIEPGVWDYVPEGV